MSDLTELYNQIRLCTKCELAKARTNAVPGEGPENAEIMFIGEAPGFHEDRQGRPFVGAAGQYLEELLALIGMKRDNVYIANVIKCFISPRVLIYTAEGYKPIKDIRVGDLVLTHQGQFRRVTYVRPHDILPAGGAVVEFTVQAQSGNRRRVKITVTPEHPFLVNGQWKRAADLQAGDMIKTLGDRCEVCGKEFFVRYDRYDQRTYHTCSPKCHNQRIMHSPETREKIRQVMHEQYAKGTRDPQTIVARAHERTRDLVASGQAKIQRMTAEERDRGRIAIAQRITAGEGKHQIGFGEKELQEILDRIGFVNAVITKVIHRRARRAFPLYNIGVEGDESYIADGIVSHNCRPPGNRDPLPEEMDACRPYLDRQIELIKPKVIITISRFAMARWFPDKKISEIHGKPKRVGNQVILPMYHPAAALHQPSLKRVLEEDFQRVPQLIQEMASLKEEAEEQKAPPPQQLSMF